MYVQCMPNILKSCNIILDHDVCIMMIYSTDLVNNILIKPPTHAYLHNVCASRGITTWGRYMFYMISQFMLILCFLNANINGTKRVKQQESNQWLIPSKGSKINGLFQAKGDKLTACSKQRKTHLLSFPSKGRNEWHLPKQRDANYRFVKSKGR